MSSASAFPRPGLQHHYEVVLSIPTAIASGCESTEPRTEASLPVYPKRISCAHGRPNNMPFSINGRDAQDARKRRNWQAALRNLRKANQ